jgi:RNA polymerase sigma-70 factor, ECF subfamily
VAQGRCNALQDERAFLERVWPHAPALRRFAERLSGNRADAEDVLQETLVRALERRGELRDPRQLKSWLFAITRTVSLNSRRGLRNVLEVLEGGLSDSSAESRAGGNLETEILDRSLSDELLAALDALSHEQREALWLREVEDLAYDEIARVLDCQVGTVRSRLARARAALAARLGKESGDGV